MSAPLMQRYTKKPVTIDAVQFTREMAEGSQPLPEGVQMMRRELSSAGRFYEHMADTNFRMCHRHVIATLEGEMDVQVGDWVITGVKGERYPCKPDIFAGTYDTEATIVAERAPVVALREAAERMLMYVAGDSTVAMTDAVHDLAAALNRLKEADAAAALSGGSLPLLGSGR